MAPQHSTPKPISMQTSPTPAAYTLAPCHSVQSHCQQLHLNAHPCFLFTPAPRHAMAALVSSVSPHHQPTSNHDQLQPVHARKSPFMFPANLQWSPSSHATSCLHGPFLDCTPRPTCIPLTTAAPTLVSFPRRSTASKFPSPGVTSLAPAGSAFPMHQGQLARDLSLAYSSCVLLPHANPAAMHPHCCGQLSPAFHLMIGYKKTSKTREGGLTI